MYRSLEIAAEKYARARQRCQGVLTNYMMKVSESLSRATIKVFCSKDDHLIRDYSRLTSYFMENAGTPEFAGVLEKIVREIQEIGTEEGIETPKASDDIKIRKRRTSGRKKGASFIKMKGAVDRLRKEEIENGLPEDEIASYAAYYQRIRYQINAGNLHARRKDGRISMIPEKQFEKLIPYMTYKPAEE